MVQRWPCDSQIVIKKLNNFGKSKSKLGTNSVESDGNFMRYDECDSTKYFALDCP